MAASCSRRLRAFKRWMRSSGIEWSAEAIRFIIDEEEMDQGEEEEGEGHRVMSISVKSTANLEKGLVIARIPKSACLTSRTSGASQLIEEADLGGSLGLSFALMYEKSLGHRSPWAAYLSVLPDSHPSLPLLWTLSQLDRLLQGTELHKTVKEDKIIIYQDWKECILPLLDLLPPDVDPNFFGPDRYFAAKSLIASRSFEIDDYHGSGMVPFADLFNHKTGAEDVHFTCLSSHYDLDDLEKGSSVSVSSAHGNGDPEPSTSSDLECSSSAGYEDDNPMVLQMVMIKDVKAGVEVFNTYGCLGNAALLHRYGFTEPENPYDIVNIDLDMVLQWSATMFSARFYRARLSLWRKFGYSGSVSENCEYFELAFSGEPQVELLILLYIILLPEDTYHKLDLCVSTRKKLEGSIGMILSGWGQCDISLDGSSESSRELLLTEGVGRALLWLADRRESLYGSNSIKEDIDALKRCCAREGKIYHSLMLRVSERKILEKFRTYAASVAVAVAVAPS